MKVALRKVSFLREISIPYHSMMMTVMTVTMVRGAWTAAYPRPYQNTTGPS